MKKFRKIEIKNPKLQKIRDGFRELIGIACKEKEREINHKKWAITRNSDGTLRENISEEDWEKVGQLNADFWAIESSLRRSIILCSACGKLEGDRIYHPKSNNWHCPRCFEYFREGIEEMVKNGQDKLYIHRF